MSRLSPSQKPFRTQLLRSVSSFLLLLIFSSPGLLAQDRLESVVLRLSWKYQFQFAGFIVAKELGYYREAGLDVTLKEFDPQLDTGELVLSGQENYGLLNSMFIAEGSLIRPSVLLASYFRRSPLVLVVKPEITKPQDLVGKKVMAAKYELQNSSLGMMLSHFGLQSEMTVLPTSHQLDDFISGKVDAMTAFTSNEVISLRERKIKHRILDPFDFGFYTTAVNLFASEQEVYLHPQRTRKFVEASNRGWEYALAHPEEAINLIYGQYSQEKSKAALRKEAEVTAKLILGDLFPIGAGDFKLAERLFLQLKGARMLDEAAELNTLSLERALEDRIPPDTTLSRSERAYLEKKRKLILCVDPLWMPFSSVWVAKAIGLASGYLDLLEDFSGVEPEFLEVDRLSESIQALRERRCDLMPLMEANEEQRGFLYFSAPILQLPRLVVTPVGKGHELSLYEFESRRVGLVEGGAQTGYFRKKFPQVTFVETNTVREGLDQLAQGKLAAYIAGDYETIHRIIEEFDGQLMPAFRTSPDLVVSVGVRNDEPQLIGVVNKLIGKLGQTKILELLANWVRLQAQLETSFAVAWRVLLAVAFVAALLLWERKRLRRFNAQLQSLADRLDASNEAKDRSIATKDKLLSIIGHDLRGTMGGLEIVFHQVVRDPKVFDQALLDAVRASTHEARHVLENLLVWGKSQQSQIGFAPTNIELASFLERKLAFFKIQVELKQVDFSWECASSLRVFADPLMLETILRNLVENAFKAVKPQDRIKISCQPNGGFVQILVADTGPGLEPERLAQLLSDPRDSPGRQTGGLGLALCLEFVGLHGGQLFGCSQPNQGTTFSLMFSGAIG